MKLAFALSLLSSAVLCGAQQWQEVYGGSLSCKDRIAVMSFMPGDYQKGIASLSLESGLTNWQAIPHELTQLRPTVATNTVAVVQNECHNITAFDATTGRYLWQKADWTEILESDGKYFYVQGTDERTIDALDPRTGDLIWALHVPQTGSAIYSYHIHQGRLYTADFVIDLSKQTLIHRWPQNLIVNALAFDPNGRIYVGDPSGIVRIYSRNFKQLRQLRLSHGHIVGLASAPKGLLAVSYEYRLRGNHSVFRVVTRQGELKWQLTWQSKDLLGAVPFVVAGSDVLLIEPEVAKNKYWLTSRNIYTGRIKWKADAGDYPLELGGPLALCGDTIYVSNRNSLHGFDLHTGAARMASRAIE